MADGGLRKSGQFLEIAGADAIAATTDLTAGEVHQDFQAGRIGERLEDPGECLEHRTIVLIWAEIRLELNQACGHGFKIHNTLMIVNMFSVRASHDGFSVQ